MDLDELLQKQPGFYSGAIEPEEVLVDSSEENAPHIVDIDNRKYVWILFGVVLLGIGIILGRSFYLQIIKGEYYQALALDNKVKLDYTRASRGVIYDQQGKVLVQNIPSFDLVVKAKEFPKNKRLDIYKRLSEILGESEKDIEQYFGKIDLSLLSSQVIKENVSHEKVLLVQSNLNDLPGIDVEVSARREYLDSLYFSHLLGYTGKLNKQEYEKNKGYLLNDTIGKTGLESVYENELRGVYGVNRLEVDSSGHVKRTLVGQEAQAGNNLVLAIDKELQKKLQDSLLGMLDKLKLKRASAVALDPRDGSVRALVSLPSFDNNSFGRGISQAEYERLSNDPDRPLFNRAISGEYPPGSTVKPFMAAAALQEKVVTAATQIIANGSIVIPNPYNSSQPAVFKDWKVHGVVNLRKAIAESCNVYFYTVGGGYGDIKGLGINRIKRYAELFGFNQLTNIDLPFERKGLIPDQEWKQENKKDKWYIGDTYNSSIGQGDVTATPLQLARYIAAIANGGVVYQPHLLSKVVDTQGNTVKEFQSIVVNKDFISRGNIKEVQEGMRQTVLSGSGRALNNIMGRNGKVSIAGKTGTAQFKDDKTHAWFVSYAPYENPELALVVLVEEGGEGHSAAVPVAKDVWEWYFNR